MKKILILIVILLLLILNNHANNVINKQDLKKIIKEKYSYIESKKKNFKKIEKEFNEYSSEGGSLISYYNVNELVYTEIFIYAEMGKNIYNYYFINNNLIYLVKKSFTYNAPIYSDNSKIVKEVNNHFIIKDNIFYITDKEIDNVTEIKSDKIPKDVDKFLKEIKKK